MGFAAVVVSVLAIAILAYNYIVIPPLDKYRNIVPVSVNYFFTRHGNAECGFCFHTETSSYRLPLPQAKQGLRLLAQEGMRKLSVAGGEPFLYRDYLAALCRFAKLDLKLESVSIVSNGTKVTEKWLRENRNHVDILAISCDSAIRQMNKAIGRADRGSGKPFDNVKQLKKIRDWCSEYGIKFKLNTVVCSLNWEEDMSELLTDLQPFRWKVFQVLVVNGENDIDERKRNATRFIVTDDQFEQFCNRHKHLKCMIPEPNHVVKSSYLVSLMLFYNVFAILMNDSLSMSTCSSWARAMVMRRPRIPFWKWVFRRR